MKKIFLLVLLLCSLPSLAIHITLTNSIYTSDESVDTLPIVSGNIPTTIRRVRFINRTDSCSEMEIALATAEYIFSYGLDSNNIDLVPIEAEVSFGNALEFEQNEVCKVDVIYTDTLTDNILYHNFSQYVLSQYPVLIPMAMYNQCEGVTQGPCMSIKLNPNISYHFDTSQTPEDKYDAITVLLRALAIGCGLHSTINPSTVQFGLYQNGYTYISALDYHIYNDSNYHYCDVLSNNISATDFLDGRIIFADGYSNSAGTESMPVVLFNDWVFGAYGNVSSNTLNTIDPLWRAEEEGFDILDAFMTPGMCKREITPYTMALLRGIGWVKTLPTGPSEEAQFYNSTLLCSSSVLLPDNSYEVELSNNYGYILDISCEIQGVDSSYTIGSFDSYDNFSYHTIPQNIQWKRNPISKNIIGQIHCTAENYIDGMILEAKKTCNVEFPYKPNRPIVQKSEITSDDFISLELKAFANGSSTYTVNYTGVTYGDTHNFTITANALDTILSNIPATQLYNISLYGTNNEGNSDSYNSTFGFSANPLLNMTVSIVGSSVIYDLSNNGTIDISDVVISSVTISDTSGNIWISSPNSHSGDPINISSLNRGYYLLSVVADGHTYTRLFIKR